MDSLPALQADCSASWEVHDWACVGQHVYSILKREDRASHCSPFACTLHAGYAKQVMHVSVPLPPEKVNSDALVLGSWQMHHTHASRQSARNYSKRCTLSSLMHPHGDVWASSGHPSTCPLATWALGCMRGLPGTDCTQPSIAVCMH